MQAGPTDSSDASRTDDPASSHPSEPDLLAQAVALHQHGQLQAASDLYQAILRKRPDHFDALHLLGVLAHESGQHAQAVDLISRALALRAQDAPAHYNLALALQALGQWPAALARYEQAIALQPDYVQAHTNRGTALQTLGQPQAAVASFEQALRIRPDHVPAWFNRGNALQDLLRWEAAIASYDQVLRLDARHVGAHYNRGNALLALQRWDAAVAAFDAALTIAPTHIGALANRARALAELRQFDAAIAGYTQALALQPEHPWLQGARLHLRMQLCDWRDHAQELAQLRRGIEQGRPVCEPFPLLALDDSAALQRQAAELYAQRQFPSNPALGPLAHAPEPAPAPTPAPTPTPAPDRLRVAYFSPDFREHPVALLSARLFELHDRSRFEVIAFSLAPPSGDAMEQRLRRGFDRFIEAHAMSDAQVATLARRLRVDIAVDLAGFTRGSRPGIFALRAAPLQLSYLGYLGTMAAPWMDYLIADRVAIPDDLRAHYSEEIIHLPCYQVNDAQRHIAQRSFSRAALGLPDDGFVYACFNNAYKITPRMFSSWMRILRGVPGSTLLLYCETETAREHLRGEAGARGVDAGRIVFAQRLPMADYLARYRSVDLVLDTFPYNAGTTASDALWTGTPLLTLCGQSLASRVAASVLHAVGLPELVTDSPAHYEALAIELARQPERLRALRSRLDTGRAHAPLFDTERFTRHLEDAYVNIHAARKAR